MREKHNIRISNQRDIICDLSNPEHKKKIIRIGNALSSEVRLQILDILKNAPLSLQEISSLLSIPLSSAALHIKKLEEAGLIITENQPGIRGSMRVCLCCFTSFYLTLYNADVDSVNRTISFEMPIGNYFDCSISPTCGLADERGALGAYDTVQAFYLAGRTRAELIWFSKGYLEYRFPNLINPQLTLEEISFSMEICSEAAGFLEDWPSDITLSINDIEIATYTSPGDFGARRGKLTPEVWENGASQYGILKTFSVDKSGSHIDRRPERSDISLADLKLDAKPYISLKISVKDDARHIGGVNLFGKKFGDYPQGIMMYLTHA